MNFSALGDQSERGDHDHTERDKMRPQLSDLTNNQPIDPETAANYHNAMMCTRLAGRAIIKVVGKCNDAQENENLGECLDLFNM